VHLLGLEYRLSPRMLTPARERGLYDRLIEGDIIQVLTGLNANFDLVVATDVFIYIGDLKAVVASAAQVLRPADWRSRSNPYPKANTDYCLPVTTHPPI